MTKWTPPDLSAGYRAVNRLTTAFDGISDTFENVISRDGTAPNYMEADFDMNGFRILNLPAPTSDNDPVRLIDLAGLSGDGEGGGITTWDNVLGKPSAFIPTPHTHVVSDIVNFQEAVEDYVGSSIIAGTNVSVTYNDTTGKTTVAFSGSAGSVDWADVTNKPATFTPEAHTQAASTITDFQEAVEDVVGSAIQAGANISVSYNDTTGKTTITASGGGSGGFSGADFVATFGGVPDGTTSNDAAFNAAEASSYKRIYLPEGRYKTTKVANQLTKEYYGPGELFVATGTSVIPNIKSQTTAVTVIDGGGIDSEYGESSDQYDMCEIVYEYVRPNTRENVNLDMYFHVGGMGKFVRFSNLSGSSGTNAHLAATATAGATSVTLNSTDHGISIGNTIGVMQNDNTTPEVVTVTNVVGAVITFTPALANTYTVTGTDYFPTYLSGYPNSPQVSKGRRTNNIHYAVTATAVAPGDTYAFLVRAHNGYTPRGGQTHFFDTATVAAFGGDMTFDQDGQYGTPWEFNSLDGGKDVGVINVSSYNRSNDTGARGVTWIHDLAKSEGSAPIDVFWNGVGKARVGIDFTQADFSSEGQRAIQLKKDQRIYFNASATGALGTRARGYWGNVQGDTYIYGANDGNDLFDIYVNNVRALRCRDSSVNTSLQLNVANNINCSGQLAVPEGATIRLNGIGGNTYFQVVAGNVVLVKNGSTVATW